MVPFRYGQNRAESAVHAAIIDGALDFERASFAVSATLAK
jgi:hypothetical protein